MKRFLFSFLMILLFSLAAQASPFLVCDPYPATAQLPISFILVFDGGTPIETGIQTNADGSVQLHYDLSGIAPGNHTVTAAAKTLWGVSAASAPFAFAKPSGVVGTPTNIKLSQ